MLVYSIVMTAFIPLIILFAGWMMQKHPPKNISSWHGYRTKRSMQSQEAWDFAQRYCGRLWIRLGLLLEIGFGLICIIYGFVSEENWYLVMLSAELIQVLLLLGTILPTERALQKRFDENGNPKDK